VLVTPASGGHPLAATRMDQLEPIEELRVIVHQSAGAFLVGLSWKAAQTPSGTLPLPGHTGLSSARNKGHEQQLGFLFSHPLHALPPVLFESSEQQNRRMWARISGVLISARSRYRLSERESR